MAAFSSVLAKFNSVDTGLGSDKLTTHSYGPMYDAMFAELSGKDEPRVLEIGIHSGAVLQAITEFLPGARVDGIDIDLSDLKFGTSNPNIRVVQLNSTDPSGPDRLQTTYDLIIEDASHRPQEQVDTFKVYAPCVRPGGVYVVEDIDPARSDWVRAELEAAASSAGMSMEWHDLRHVKNQFDDIVAVMRRP